MYNVYSGILCYFMIDRRPNNNQKKKKKEKRITAAISISWQIYYLTFCVLKCTCSAVLSKFSISKLLVRDVCLAPWGIICGSVDDGAGELSTSGE